MDWSPALEFFRLLGIARTLFRGHPISFSTAGCVGANNHKADTVFI